MVKFLNKFELNRNSRGVTSKAYNRNTPPLVPLQPRVVRPTGGSRESGERGASKIRERQSFAGAYADDEGV